MRKLVEMVISVTLMLSSVYNLIQASDIICKFEKCKSLKLITIFTTFPRAVSLGCLVSRIVIMYNVVTNESSGFESNMEDYDARYPMNGYERQFGRRVIGLVAATCAVAILPINVYRIVLLHDTYHTVQLTVFYTLMYVQNGTVCVAELTFIKHCIGLFQRFRSINREMSAMKSEPLTTVADTRALTSRRRQQWRVWKFAAETTDVTNRLKQKTTGQKDITSHKLPSSAVHTVGRESFGSGGGGTPASVKLCRLVDVVECLKFRHKYVSNAVRHLNELYNVQFVMSLCSLFFMAMCDVYELLFRGQRKSRATVFYVAWLFQYSFRFCMILMTTHVTAKEAQKSKTIITDINNRSIDKNTKDELQLFLNEICSRSVDFTTFDMFTLNLHLIISIIVSATTYLLILSQFS